MKSLLAAFALFLSGATYAAAPVAESVESQQQMSKESTASARQSEACEQLRAEKASSELLAQRGCCSHHGGVCGCSGGQQTCCDGTPSPSCTCVADQPSVQQN